MLYALLCYKDEDVVCSWSNEQDKEVMSKLQAIQERLAAEGKMGVALRLLPTTAATTLRTSGREPLVIDGPFAETKEQLLGFYAIDVENLDEAIEIAREIGEANPGGSYEVRPIALFIPDQRAVST